MADVTLRLVKGSALTNQEVDDNFDNLNTAKLEASDNLSDVADAATARGNLNVYSVQEAQEFATAMAIALG
jgi:hypothetical protein